MHRQIHKYDGTLGYDSVAKNSKLITNTIFIPSCMCIGPNVDFKLPIFNCFADREANRSRRTLRSSSRVVAVFRDDKREHSLAP